MSDVTLYVWGKADGLPSSSPFCLKTLYSARYKKISHKVKYVGARMPAWVKRGLLPAATIKEAQVEDSTAILKALDQFDSGSRRLYPSDPALRTEALLLEDWADESFVRFLVYYRWVPDHNWEPFSSQIFAGAPFFVKSLIGPMMRKNVLKSLQVKEIANWPEDERREKFKDLLGALEQRLQGRPFLITDSPTAPDFTVFPILQIIRASRIQELAPIIGSHAQITQWMKQMEEVCSE